jgi:hypothetical protein
MYLGKYTHCSSVVPYKKHSDDGYGIAETCRCDKETNFKKRNTVTVHLLVTFSPVNSLIMHGVRYIKHTMEVQHVTQMKAMINTCKSER